jgi:hypothetical protein
MNNRPIKKKERANYHALLNVRKGTWKGEWGTGLKDLPFGCAVSFAGRNYTVAGYDTVEDQTFVRLVDQHMTRELSMVKPEEVTKTTAPIHPWRR